MISLLGFLGTASITLKIYSLLSPSNSALKYLKIYSIISPKYFFPLPCDFMFRVLCNCIYPPWNMASYHLESIPKISLNLFYFPKYNSECTPYLSQTAPQFNPISNPQRSSQTLLIHPQILQYLCPQMPP